MAHDERRGSPRFACRVHVIIVGADGEPIRCESADVSQTGIQVVADGAVQTGQTVTFHLRLALGWTEQDFLTLPATVVRCVEADGGYLLGARFDADLAAPVSKRLDLLVRVLSGALEIDPQDPVEDSGPLEIDPQDSGEQSLR